MDNIKNDHYYIQKLQQDLTFIATHMRNVNIEELGKNEILQDSMLFRMIQISENAKKLTEEYKMEHAGIPWKAIYGLRNKFSREHFYRGNGKGGKRANKSENKWTGAGGVHDER